MKSMEWVVDEECCLEKEVLHRISVLQLAEALGNISEACRQSGMDRTSFYNWRRRFQKHGIEGLNDRPSIHKSHPHTTPIMIREKIVSLALEHPDWGCVRLANDLGKKNICISSPTVQKILIKCSMGTKHERIIRLEQKAIFDKYTLKPEQISLIERTNPCFRERYQIVSHPGALLVQSINRMGKVAGIGQIYLQAVIDTYSSYAFGMLGCVKNFDSVMTILHNYVLPFYRQKRIVIKTLQTNNTPGYYGFETHPYERHLTINGIAHQLVEDSELHLNGFVIGLIRTVSEEFFEPQVKSRRKVSLDDIHQAFDEWLFWYNHGRSHPGYPNMGKSPWDMMLPFVKNETVNNDG